MLKQKNSSIEVPELFRESYRMNSGDVYKALLTIENVLVDGRKDPKRELLAKTQKLSPITSGLNYSDDRFGTWYHLFGMALYGYTMNNDFLVGWAEQKGSRASNFINQAQKSEITMGAGVIGVDLRAAITSKSYLSQKTDRRYLSSANYLRRSEDFRDRLELPIDKNLQGSFTMHILGRRLDGITLSFHAISHTRSDCKVELIPIDGEEYPQEPTYKMEHVNIPTDANVSIKLPDNYAKKVRCFVSCRGNAEASSFRSALRHQILVVLIPKSG